MRLSYNVRSIVHLQTSIQYLRDKVPIFVVKLLIYAMITVSIVHRNLVGKTKPGSLFRQEKYITASTNIN